MVGDAYIYVLVDPRTGEIRYVGKTKNPIKRLKGHLMESSKGKSHVQRWIRQLIRLGYPPEIVVMEVVDEVDWETAERELIKELRVLGCPLTNIADGGDAPSGSFRTRAMYQKVSAALTGRKMTEEVRRRVSEGHKGIPQSLECRKKKSIKAYQQWSQGRGRKRLLIEVDGITKSVREWSKVTGTPAPKIFKGLEQGMSGKDAIYQGPSHSTVPRLLTIDGVTKRLVDWAREVGVQSQVVKYRLRAGRSPKEAVFDKKHIKRRRLGNGLS